MKERKYIKKDKALIIGSTPIYIGERKRIQLNVSSLYDYTQVSIPIEVIRGKHDGPTLFISAAIHGDEINGVEIIKRLLKKTFLNRIKGTLITIPVVNVFGFNSKSRYLPDRRDLNRCFPGSSNGSPGSRLAYIFMKQIISKCTHGIDLHTGAIHRTNLPQIRACLDDPETEKLAKGFGVPVIINSKNRDGSLREAARKKRVNTLLFEGGEALRFDESVIRIGLNGCVSVMRNIGMLNKIQTSKRIFESKVFVAQHSYWVRASHSGTFMFLKKIGDTVQNDETIAVITDTFGDNPYEVVCQEGGIIIGLSKIPLVNKGDAIAHIATFKSVKRVKKAIDLLDDFD